jgi:hypothetical protein
MMIWETWKKGFDTWESKTAALLEQWLKSPLVLQPMGSILTVSMKMKAASDKAVAAWWAGWGLPTRRDQERALHALNQLQSRMIDLEERLTDFDTKRKN